MGEELQKIIDVSWSNYSDLDYWISAMTRGEQDIPKHVLKMAMKHLRSDLKIIHDLACELKESA